MTPHDITTALSHTATLTQASVAMGQTIAKVQLYLALLEDGEERPYLLREAIERARIAQTKIGEARHD